MEKIIRNVIQCKHCGDIIESTHVHDFKFCSCKSCAVDGGHINNSGIKANVVSLILFYKKLIAILVCLWYNIEYNKRFEMRYFCGR